MAVVVTNGANVQPIQGQEVVCATIAGGSFDNVDAYVQAASAASLVFRIYATVGAVRSLVAQANYAGPSAARLSWSTPSSVLQPVNFNQPPPSLHSGASSYDLVVFAPNPAPPLVNTTLAGANDSDATADVNASGTVALNPDFTESTVLTQAGYNLAADIAAIQAILPACKFTLYASCGAGSVEAAIYSQSIAGFDSTSAIVQGLSLPVATQYRLAVRKTVPDNALGPNCTASLATYALSAVGSGALAGEVTGTLAATVVSGPFTTANLRWANTVAAATLGTNRAGATFGLTYDAGLTVILLDPANGVLFKDAGGNTRAAVELTHGRVTAGGALTDYKTIIGPLVGIENTYAAVYLLAPATIPGGNNYALLSDGSNTYINAASGVGNIYNMIGATLVTQLSNAGTYTWAPAITNPGLIQTASAVGAGVELKILAQNALAGSAATGGQLTLRSGQNDPGLQYSGIRAQSTTLFIDAAATAVLQVTATAIIPLVNNFLWISTAAGPNISQSVAVAAGAPMTVHAQDAGGAGASAGGDLQLQVGTGVNGGANGLLGFFFGGNTAAQRIYRFSGAGNFTIGATASFRLAQDNATGVAAQMQFVAQTAGGTNDGGTIFISGGAPAGPGTVYGSILINTPLNPGELDFTPVNGNQALTPLQSNANVLNLLAGATLAFTITLQRRIADTSLLFVRNNTTQTATIQYLTGAAQNLATGTSALLCSNGTGLIKIMAGT